MTMQADLVQQRTIRTLVTAQAIGATGITIGIAVASLLAKEISGSESMAGLAQTFQVLGAAVASYLLALLMARRGRRIGLVTGMLVGAAGSLLCVVAGVIDSMVLLLVGAALLGTMTAANLGARYAATDLAEPESRGRALSLVVWATTIGAVAGPNLAGPTGSMARWLGLPELTGPFLFGTVGMLGAALVVATRLRPDPLLLARERAGVAPGPPTGTSWGRVAEVMRTTPTVTAGIVAIACAHAAMVAVMVMTPLHMEHGGATLTIVGVVISIHVAGMFAFSPLVGWASDVLGRAVVLGAGGVVLAVSLVFCGLAPEGSSWQIFGGLFLLGLGWSFVTVAGSTLVTDGAPLSARTDVQGASDLVMGVTAAAAGALAGVVVGFLGYGWLNVFAGLLVVGVLAASVAAGRGGTPTSVEDAPVLPGDPTLIGDSGE